MAWKVKRSTGDLIFDFSNTAFMIFLVMLTVYPMLYVLMASFSNSFDLMAHTGFLLFPLRPNINAYKYVVNNPSIFSGYRNTLIVMAGGTAINMILTCMGAYVLSRKQFAIRKALMVFIVFTMYFSGGLIPRYLLVSNTLHLRNTYWAIMLPGAISTWNLIVMRTAFAGIPESLLESARIDGANDFRILWSIVVPVALPTIAVIMLFYMVSHWNAWFDSMIYLRRREMYPIQLILREILVSSSTDSMLGDVANEDKEAIGESIKYATIIVSTIPILLVYPFLQKYFVKGVMIGSIKG
jgi:putative aldouronate transport system permease protein